MKFPLVVSADKYLVLPSGKYCWTGGRIGTARKLALSDFRYLIEDVDLLPGHARINGVVLMVGAPGSGKTTWVEQWKNFEGVVGLGELWTLLFVDAMNLHPSDRTFYKDIARRAGLPVHVVWVDTPLEVCLERNARRPSERRVPEERVRGAHRRLQPPNEMERFTSIKIVTHEEGS